MCFPVRRAVAASTRVAQAVQHQDVDFLDARGALVRHADVDVGLGSALAHRAAAAAGERDHGHLAFARAASTAASTLAELPLVDDRQQHVARLRRAPAPAWRRSRRSRSRWRSRSGSSVSVVSAIARQPGPLALEAADELGREMLRVGGRAAVAAGQHLAAAGDAADQRAAPRRRSACSSISAAWYLRSALSKNCCWMRCSSMVTDDMTRVPRAVPCAARSLTPRRTRARSHSMRSPSIATTSKRHGGSARQRGAGSAARRRRCGAAWRRRRSPRRRHAQAARARAPRRRPACRRARAGSGRSRRRARAARARPDNCARTSVSPRALQVRERPRLGRVARPLRRARAAFVDHRSTPRSLLQAAAARGRRAALSAPAPVRRRHADRQPRRHHACARSTCWRWSTRSPARTRATARRCCAASASTKPLLALHEHNEREAAAGGARTARARRAGRLRQRRRHAGDQRPGRGAGGGGAGGRLPRGADAGRRAARWRRSSVGGDARRQRLRVRRLPADARRRARRRRSQRLAAEPGTQSCCSRRRTASRRWPRRSRAACARRAGHGRAAS